MQAWRQIHLHHKDPFKVVTACSQFGIVDAHFSLTFVTIRSHILQSRKCSHNKRQSGISIIYNEHELSAQNVHSFVPHNALKNLV